MTLRNSVKNFTTEINLLVKIYFDALYNPPEGVIGVGAISYVEQKLREAQE